MKSTWIKQVVLITFVLLLSACAKTPEPQPVDATNTEQVIAPIVDERDPFESMNRSLWDFNWNVLDKYVLRPLAVGYSEYLPRPAQTGVRNFVTNLEEARLCGK
ncbi:MlaA family lipoprotein [Psychrosphaera algicola]|uniref:MlaA family lipoprotein n=1 Tax=Psychrosphaera algicola TaxID=3023714 RepID=A0ABT5FJU7_9GAMM|nr:MlaA family lipoprotein [Psychrosphaera sp. G1-22]MDC2891468.1 MlaA family lipoprotein [Psychrosphaera sp. G1-22]